MLPPSLVSVYQKYKEDTNAVAAWLASTAKSRGYDSTGGAASSSTTTAPSSSKRLKGKARKDAKAALQQSLVSSTNPSGPEYVIALSDFVPLAKFIAGCKKPAIPAPLSFTNTLNRVISTRSGFTKKLATIRDDTDASSDSTHAYFVRVLEEVREVLKPRGAPAAPDPPILVASSSPGAVGEIGGRFAGLSVEDPSEAFLNAPDIERPTPAENDKATYKAEPHQELTEILFAYNLLLGDLNEIRSRILGVWHTYKDDMIDLITAAIASNTACDLARELIEEMAPMFEPHGGVIEVAKKSYHHKCLDLGFRGPFPSQYSPDLIFQTYDLADETYVIPIVLLEGLQQCTLPGDVAVFGGGQVDTHDQSAEWASIPNPKRFSNDNFVIWGMFSDISIMNNKFPGLLVDDEFIRGRRELERTGKVSMSLVFAAQVCLDIHHHLRDQLSSAHKDFMRQLEGMENDLKLHLDFVAEGYFLGWPYSEHEALNAYRDEIKGVQSNPIQLLKVAFTAQLGQSCPPTDLTILKYSPVISGLFLFRMRRQIYDTSLKLANASRGLLYPVQLYNALRQEGLLSTKEAPSGCWQDMELVCRLMGEESFFVGDRPKKQDDYIKNLLLQRGLTVAALSKGWRNIASSSHRLMSKKGARLIKLDRMPVMDMFVDRYVCKTEQSDWTAQALESIISRSTHLHNHGNRAAKATGPQMTPEKLIESLVFALRPEALTLAFSFLTVQRSAWGMLRAVRNACEELVLQVDGDTYIKNESKLQGIVCLILFRLMEGDDRLFVKAGEAIKEELRIGRGQHAIHHLYDMGYLVTTPRGEPVFDPVTETINQDVDAE